MDRNTWRTVVTFFFVMNFRRRIGFDKQTEVRLEQQLVQLDINFHTQSIESAQEIADPVIEPG